MMHPAFIGYVPPHVARDYGMGIETHMTKRMFEYDREKRMELRQAGETREGDRAKADADLQDAALNRTADEKIASAMPSRIETIGGYIPTDEELNAADDCQPHLNN